MENTISRTPLQVQVCMCMCVNINFLQQQGGTDWEWCTQTKMSQRMSTPQPKYVCAKERMGGRRGSQRGKIRKRGGEKQMEGVGGMQPKRLREGAWGQANKCASEKHLRTNTSGYVLRVLCLLKNMFCDAHSRHEWFQCLSCSLLFGSLTLTSNSYMHTRNSFQSSHYTLLLLYTHVFTCIHTVLNTLPPIH